MAALLTDQQVDDALAALEGWEREGDRLVKRLRVAESDREGFEAAVTDVGDELDHHAVVEGSGDAVVLALWTHSSGGITAADVDLAARLDTLLSGARTWRAK